MTQDTTQKIAAGFQENSSTAIREASESLAAARLGWPLHDVMAAKVVVKRLVGSRMRKGPTDLLLLPDHLVEEWYTDEAVRYLQEQKERHYQPVAELK